MENIRRDLEKECANRVQDYLKQLKEEMRAKIESKTTAIRNQYKTEHNQEKQKTESGMDLRKSKSQ